MSVKILPAKGIVVLKEQGVQKTKSGLELPTTSKPEVGEVIEIGSGKLPVIFKIGDKIVYRKYTENKINIGGTEQLNFIKFEDVLGVVTQ